MKDANIVFAYVCKEFPDNRNIVEDYSDPEGLLAATRKNAADIYIFSSINDHENTYLKLALEIRIHYQSRSVLFVINNLEDLRKIVNLAIAPDYVFENEVTEPEIAKYFSLQNRRSASDRLLVFVMGNKKYVINKQSIIYAQAKDKKVSLCAFGQSYVTTLTIAELEKLLPENFARIDKGIIVNTNYISHFDPSIEIVQMTNKLDFPVSRRGERRLLNAVKTSLL